MKKYYLLLIALLVSFCGTAKADGLSWNLGSWGTVQLPGSYSDISPLYGYDFIQKQQIVGADATLLTLFKEVNGYVGAVGAFESQGPNVEPYLALGADVAKYVPVLNQFKSVSVQGFGLYSTSVGGRFDQHLGAGLAVSYSFK